MEWNNPFVQTNKTIEERFWEKVDRSRGEDSCWEWLGGKTPDGYGLLWTGKNRIGAHRFSYMLSHNIQSLSRNSFVCHSCDNPSCCNPKHLWLGSNRDNQLDYFSKGLPNNHPTGKDNHSTKLTEKQVLEIRELRISGLSIHKIAKRFGVVDSAIFYILKRHTWKHI